MDDTKKEEIFLDGNNLEPNNSNGINDEKEKTISQNSTFELNATEKDLKEALIEEKTEIKKIKKPKKSNEEKKYKNSYIYGFIFIIFSILLEIASFIRLGLGFLPTNFAIEFAIILIMAGIIFIVPTEPAKITILSVFFGIQFIMNIANASLYKVMYDMITVDMIFTLGFETAQGFEMNQLDIPTLVMCGVILVLFILAIVFGSKYMPRFKIRKSKVAIVSLLVLLLSVEMLGFGLFTVSKEAYFSKEANYVIDDNRYIFSTPSVAKYASLKKYGFWSFYINNASKFFNYKKDVSDKELTELTSYLDEGKNFKYVDSTYQGNNVSGSLAGDNLIVIMLESIEWFAIDPFNTPNLYNFINNDAISFQNFHSRNKTNISENIGMLGNMPNDYSFKTINNNVGISTPNSLPNLFKANGYESVNFFHSYYGEMYDRYNLNKALGFNNVYALNDTTLQNKSEGFGDFIDDGQYINNVKNQLMPSNKSFFSFFTTVTTHGPYENSNERFQDYYQKFENNYDQFCSWVESNNLNYLTPSKSSHEYKILKEYKAKAMSLESMFNIIYNHLIITRDNNNQPLYNNTSIVLYADHNAYYSDLCYSVKDTNKYANDNTLYNVPFVLFNKSLAASRVDTFCNTYDIYATICDLYGLSYNKNLTQGYSVFSNEIKNSVFVSSMCGAFDNNFFTVTFEDYTSQSNDIITNSKLNEFKQKLHGFLTKQDYIETYYRINYEKYVLNN